MQCYVAPAAGVALDAAARELGGFAKVWLEPGESATVEIELDERAFAHWDPTSPDIDDLATRAGAMPMLQRPANLRTDAGWWIDPGTYQIELGASVADIRQRMPIVIAEQRRIGS